MSTSNDANTIRLQLAMAFGQGAGVMIATGDALNALLSAHGDLVDSAVPNWNTTHWAFIELMRLLGRLSAHKAATRLSPVIEWPDIDACKQVLLDLCPCDPKKKAAIRDMF
jgi:hypothetical protein